MTALILRRALADYVRRPFNVALLVAFPVVMVVALGGQLASFSKLLSTGAKPAHLEVATAAWAAAAVTGLAGFFQVVGARATDRRLAAASTYGARPVIAGRLLAAGCLALVASAAALAALAVRSGIADPARAVPTIVAVAVIYIAVGVLVGTFVRSEMNGALVVSIIWMLDVFVGSGLGGGSSSVLTRFFPLHFPTMILTDQAAQHGGPIGDAGWTAVWAVGLAGVAVWRLVATTRPARLHDLDSSSATARPTLVTAREVSVSSLVTAERAVLRPHDVPPAQASPGAAARRPAMPVSHAASALLATAREYRRNRVLWVLLVAVPVMFIALAAAQTPTIPIPVSLVDGTRRFTEMFSMRQIHAGEMASIASALLAGVAGLFVVTGSAAGDRRLVLAGFRPRQVLAGHLGVIAGAAVLTTAVSLAVSALFFSPRSWVEYAGADLLIALTYAMVGVLLGPITGRLGGLYVILLAAAVDVGFGQTVMYHPVPPTWGVFLPGHGAGRLLVDGSFTSGFEQYGHLLVALGWLAGLTAAAALTFRHQIGSKPITRVSRLTPSSGESAGGEGTPAPASMPSHSDLHLVRGRR
ncbi:MAG TPA: hypothetical protein VFH70_10880 [Acidimicrobiales bacterium]|nr:hypothetical protein [Acidimicrobiales bacterium]